MLTLNEDVLEISPNRSNIAGQQEGEPMSNVTPEHILQVGFGFWASKMLLSAVELGVFTELGKGPMSLDELRTNLGLHPRSARDFFDALVAHGFLDRDDAGAYRNTRE